MQARRSNRVQTMIYLITYFGTQCVPQLLTAGVLLTMNTNAVRADELKTPHLSFLLSKQRLAVAQLPKDAATPKWAQKLPGFSSITRTDDELSILAEEHLIPKNLKVEPGFRALKIEGPLDFTLVGILSSVLRPLAQANISIFAVSTYNTDYVLVKDDRLTDAIAALKAEGHSVKIE